MPQRARFLNKSCRSLVFKFFKRKRLFVFNINILLAMGWVSILIFKNSYSRFFKW